MTVEPMDEPGCYRVVYFVNLSDPFTPQCDCRTGCLSDKTCRHVKAAQAFRDGEEVPQ